MSNLRSARCPRLALKTNTLDYDSFKPKITIRHLNVPSKLTKSDARQNCSLDALAFTFN